MTKQAERDYPLKVEQASLFEKPYNAPRVLREFAFALELLQQRFTKGSVLDLGCGPGWTSLMLARSGYDVVGVDISDRMIEIARERAIKENTQAQFFVQDMEELELAKRDFDGVLLFDCLHHCPAYQEVIHRAYEHLKPGGWILLFETTLLHRFSPHAKHESNRYGITELGFTRRQLGKALKIAGFQQTAHFHDPGPAYRGFFGFLHAQFRLWCDYLFYFPQLKNIVVSRKAA